MFNLLTVLFTVHIKQTLRHGQPYFVRPVQVGFNAGDGYTFYGVEGSRTPEIAENLVTQGRYMFRIDSAEIRSGGCNVEGDSIVLHNISPRDRNSKIINTHFVALNLIWSFLWQHFALGKQYNYTDKNTKWFLAI